MKEEIEKVIKNDINPMLMADGGSCEFVSEKDGVVKVRLMGACSSCPFSIMTLQNLVEQSLKEKVKGVKKVEAA
jgi:Fe-S cluster biogenesis protein NfuA